MNWSTIVSLLQKGEGDTQKFFTTLQTLDEFGTTLVAMANTHGGSIIIGFDLRNYHLTGCTLDEAWFQKATTFCEPTIPFEVASIERNNKTIILVTVPKQPAFCFYKNTYYVMNKASVVIAETPLENPEVTPSPMLQIREEETENNSVTFEIELPEETETHEMLNAEEQPTPRYEAVTIQETRTSTDPSKLNKRQKSALDFLYREQSIQNKKYRELFQVSHKTAHLELVEMVENGLILPSGAGRSTCYILSKEKTASQSF